MKETKTGECADSTKLGHATLSIPLSIADSANPSGWVEPAETNPKKAFEIDYEAFPAGSYYKPDPPRRNFFLLRWDRFWLSIPRSLHWLVWYPIVVAILLMTVLLWQSGATKLLNVKSTLVSLDLSLPTYKGTGSFLNNEPAFYDYQGKLLTQSPLQLKFDFNGMDPVGTGVKVSVRVAFDSYFNLINYPDSKSIIQEDLFFMSDEALRNYT